MAIFASPDVPNIPDFTTFLRTVVQIGDAFLPTGSDWITLAYNLAMETVNIGLNQASPLLYTQAVYNLGADILINMTPDQNGQNFFATARENFKITAFAPGVVQSTSDSGTSTSLNVPEAFGQLTFADLQNLKTPYGRAYLAIAQKWGTNWGIS